MRAKTLRIAGASLLVVASVTVLSWSRAAEAKKPSAKEKDIRKLLEITGSAKMGKQMMDQMIKQMKVLQPAIPAKFWEEFKKEVKPSELVDMIVPIYAKHLTHDDIKGLIKFYESPVGRKFISVQPAIMRESMAAGQAWGRKLGMKIAKKLQAEGIR
jgi:hypothetical protein